MQWYRSGIGVVFNMASGHGGRGWRMRSSTLMVAAIMWTLSEASEGECLLVGLCLSMSVLW